MDNPSTETLKQNFDEDGVIVIKQCLDSKTLKLAENCFNWTLENPGPGAGNIFDGRKGMFYQDQANPDSFPTYRELLTETLIPEIALSLISGVHLWLMYEQIWLKEGGATRRTPWHQDLPYLPATDEDVVVLWINLEAVSKKHCLEFVRGSHRGPLYNPSAFSANDDSANLFSDPNWPQLPDIERARDNFDIVAWDIRPGDIVCFHPATLHGGGATSEDSRRRTLSFRFFGENTKVAHRPHDGMANVEGYELADGGRHPLKKVALAANGSAFRHPDFPKLRP